MGIKPRRAIVQRKREPEPEVVEVDDDGYDVDEDDATEATDEDVVEVDDDTVDYDEPEPVQEPERRVPRRVVQASPTRKVVPPPAPVKKSAVAVKTAAKPVAPSKPAPKPVAKPAARVTVEEEAEADEQPKTIKVQKVETMALAGLFEGLLDGLQSGQAIVISRLGETKWQISTSSQIKGVSAKLSGQAYWDKVTTPEYQEFMREWENVGDYEAKKKYAKKLGAKWETHAKQQVDLIRLFQAVMDAKGLQKYLDQYQTRASRDAIKG